MSQNQATVAYPPPLAPPPAGYPTKDGETHLQNPVPVETKSRGDGFLKGCELQIQLTGSNRDVLNFFTSFILQSWCPVLLLCLGRLLLRIDGVS
ncbi:hypothetical protein DKX38_023460 [Salix brachista]|uniref:Uncharacterized protein n=1 Tax=Salix brachista TaxID=2182728 RepID=A0A5N5JIZ0_9ROSI|nr:hypothetical protein DKX38_023460 [Salix brachista]